MAKPATHGNGFAPDVTKQFVASIERLYEEREAEHSAFMSRAKAILAEISEVYAMAKEKGIPRRELKLVVRTRALERKLNGIRDDLEPEQQETYNMIRHALGDLAELPLGAAVLDGMPSAAAGTLDGQPAAQ